MHMHYQQHVMEKKTIDDETQRTHYLQAAARSNNSSVGLECIATFALQLADTSAGKVQEGRRSPGTTTTTTTCSSTSTSRSTSMEEAEHKALQEELHGFAMAAMNHGDFQAAEETWRYLLYLQSSTSPTVSSSLVVGSSRRNSSSSCEEEIIESLANIGKCCQSSGRLEEALSCYRDALQIKTHCCLKNEPRKMQLLLASILYDIGMIHSQMLLFLQQGGGRANIIEYGAVTTTTTRNHHRELASKAIKSFSLSLQLRVACLGEQHPAVASVQHNIATILLVTNSDATSRRDLRSAITFFETSLATRKMVFGPQHPEVASSLRHLAMAHKANGDYREAVKCLDGALEILKCIPCEGFLGEVIIELSHVKRALLLMANSTTAT